jgi:hypothetical protein
MFRVQAGDVSQQRNGEDGATAAQETEGDTHDNRQGDGQRDHGSQLAFAWLASTS